MAKSIKAFAECEICGDVDWLHQYQGVIRKGSFGTWEQDGLVMRCGGCGVGRLAEEQCLDETDYETDKYRTHIGQDVAVHTYYQLHDPQQFHALRVLPLERMRGVTIADVGSAGGSFLDVVAGLVERAIAIEPCNEYHDVLLSKGYDVFGYAPDATVHFKEVVDYATSFQVIEHVLNPREFLEGIAPLLKKDGTLTISTPNLNDILLRTANEIYAPFFYRKAHRWYFDESSLTRCAELAGYEVTKIRYIHRYPISNYILWLRDRAPQGLTRLPELDNMIDALWTKYLEENGFSDTLFIECKKN